MNHISSIKAELNVPDLPAFGLADSPVILQPAGLLIDIDLLFSDFLLRSKPTGNIHSGRLSIINLAFSNNDFILPKSSTSLAFCEITTYLWLWNIQPYT